MLFRSDKELNEYSVQLESLRKDGVNLISALKQEIAAAKKNKLLSQEDREKLISADNDNKLSFGNYELASKTKLSADSCSPSSVKKSIII